MINRTMMHHPMHLHGHFFRIVNGQGNHASLKHTVDVPPMETTVIRVRGGRSGRLVFPLPSTLPPRSGMARVVHYEGFSPYPDTAAICHKLYRDPLFVWGTADIMSNMTQGYLELSNTQNILNLEWEAGWANVPDTEWETTFLYERYFNRFFRLIAGVNTEGTVTTGPLEFDVESNRGVFGFMYKLPLNVDTTAWADTDGGARVKAAKSIPLTPRLHLGGEWNTTRTTIGKAACISTTCCIKTPRSSASGTPTMAGASAGACGSDAERRLLTASATGEDP